MPITATVLASSLARPSAPMRSSILEKESSIRGDDGEGCGVGQGESRYRRCRIPRSWARIARLGERRGRSWFMAEIGNEPRLGGRLLTKIRGMFEHRAEWLYLL